MKYFLKGLNTVLKSIFLLTLILFYHTVNAQDFKISPSLNIIGKGYSTDEQVIAEGKFTNTSNQKKTYHWYRIKKQLPMGWLVTTCVPGKCYSAEKDTGIFTLDKGKTGILDQNFFPNNRSGAAEIELYVYEKNQKATAIKVVFSVVVEEKVGFKKD